jgi:2-polyprenyl-6-methoxyphenol hydroxylase-like FAD-dependent oxidoreductase
MGRIASVAIVGGGPSGAALGTFLAREGLDVVLFHQAKRPPIIVGESLVPAVVPYIRRLERGWFMVSHGLAGNDPDELRIH